MFVSDTGSDEGGIKCFCDHGVSDHLLLGVGIVAAPSSVSSSLSSPLQDPDWFHFLTGAHESEWLAERHNFLEAAPPIDAEPRLGSHLLLKNRVTSEVYDAGAFSVW
jgi:hypothetical protein